MTCSMCGYQPTYVGGSSCPRCGALMTAEVTTPSAGTSPHISTTAAVNEANTETRRVERPPAGETVDRSALLRARAEAEINSPALRAVPQAPPVDRSPPPPTPPARGLPVGRTTAIPASLGARFASCLLDGLLLMAPGVVLGLMLQLSGANAFGYSDSLSPVEVVIAILGLLWYAIVIAYPILGWARGQTVGMRVLQIRLVGENDMRSVGVGPAVVRWLMMVVMGLPCYLGYLSILLDRSGYYRGWNDQVARTRMVQGDL